VSAAEAGAGAAAGDDPVVGELRAQITGVDRELLAAVNRRLEIVRRLHDHKRERGLPLRDPAREAALLSELRAANGGPISERGLSEFFEQVLALTRRELHGD
jgi:chorismate mutase / prephenate dehydratase